MGNNIGKNERLYRLRRLLVRDRVDTEGGTCAIPSPDCPLVFDLSLRSPHPWSFTIHHPHARAFGGDPDALDNMVPAHKRCNEIFGVGPREPVAKNNFSEEWP
jgi:hypothetical protein